ncbi:MAG: metallophosphoesterase [Acidobacteria bacterium]|nr:metallophosphoesterase [Acidobacteriota bacterium]MBV9478875.1 metallophosphoesterase [Acidobacteriota bacterium]
MLLFLAIALAIFIPLNWIVWRALTRIHPRRRRAIGVAVVAGNLLWPFIPFLRRDAGWMRVFRALAGPVWVGWTVFVLLYAMLVVIVVLAWLPFRRRASFARFAHAPSTIVLWTLLIGFIAGWIQCVVPLHVARVPVTIANLPPSLDGARVVVMGDLHVGLFSRPSRLARLFATAGAQHPRAVVLAGDLIDDDPHYVPKLLDGTRALAADIPLFAVYGNHEMYGDPIEVASKLRGSRVRLLVNEGAAVGDLWIAGVSDFAASGRNHPDLAPNLDRALASKPRDAFPLVVAHQPEIARALRARQLPLAVCAHTHGGQFGIRPLHWSLAGVFLPYHMGLYKLGASQLYVSTGAGYWVLPFRLGMTPEIAVIELRPAAPRRTSPRP